MQSSNDTLTVCALAVIAMCVVTFAHEALGHGGACLWLGGHIEILSSSIFRCDLRSGWIDPAGPAGNLLVGILALAVRTGSPPGFARTRLLLLLVTAFSFFWEGGYLMRAMIIRDGDLYFFARFLLGEPSLLVRAVGFAIGLAIYVLGARIASSGLSGMFDLREARSVARIAWVAATFAAALAALAYRGQPLLPDVRDAVLEIGLASVPLLFIPRESDAPAQVRAIIGRSYP
ncbi:MAG TPA: hypothetical protein VG867_06430, partial [Rhizomicrobium sp.]|nr:hypothetical protein [Rhizomicrobium sp.]